MTASNFVRGYTIALGVVGVLAGFVAWLEVDLIRELEAEGATTLATVLRVDQVVALVLGPLSLLAVAARVRRWQRAQLLTRVVSVAVAVIFPIGTALFVYWFAWVRKREAAACCSN